MKLLNYQACRASISDRLSADRAIHKRYRFE